MKPTTVHDRLAAALARTGAPFFRFLAHNHRTMPRYREAADQAGFQVRSVHYYEPTYPLTHLPADLTSERSLPGLDFNESFQLELLRGCVWREELRTIPLVRTRDTEFAFESQAYGVGDADMLYNVIRLFRPGKLLEIGSGDSTLMAQLAIAANRQSDPAYSCEHICIEPYEMPWLESIGVNVVRERVENLRSDMFASLRENDILFIDSSHVIRPYGDVLKEYHEIVPRLAPGVIVHVHDIFTPRDYPARWLREERRLWNEQYLLEAFLAFNNAFEIMAAVNWLKHSHFEALAQACGFLRELPEAEPGAFWFRRKLPATRVRGSS
jgi:hypothetical protein